jgi:hypothetical protein
MRLTKTCFVIAPIGAEGSPTRERSDRVLEYILKPVAEECGYEVVLRADHIGAPGMITDQVIQHVVGDELVIADLTEENPNVFYELALRHAIRRPLVQIIEKGEAIPFDLANFRTIEVDHRDLRAAALAKEELHRHIQAVEEDPSRVDNPISTSLDLQALRGSGDPIQASVAELNANMASIQREVRALAHNVAIFDKMKIWDALSQKLSALQDAWASGMESDISNIDGIHSLDDLMNKLEEIHTDLKDQG